MQKNEFYKVTGLTLSDEKDGGGADTCRHIAVAVIDVNKKHKIFTGHFPGNPIIPGVCLIQILKETLSGIIKKKIILCNARSIRFLAIINPNITKTFNLNINYKLTDNGSINVNSEIFSEEKTFFKFRGNFKCC